MVMIMGVRDDGMLVYAERRWKGEEWRSVRWLEGKGVVGREVLRHCPFFSVARQSLGHIIIWRCACSRKSKSTPGRG